VEELSLDLDTDGMPSRWEDTLDNMLWHELLLPFIGVKKLRIGSSLTFELSQALESVAGGLVPDFLPELQELDVQLVMNHAKKAFSAFIEARESDDRPVYLLTPDRRVPLPYWSNSSSADSLDDRSSSLWFGSLNLEETDPAQRAPSSLPTYGLEPEQREKTGIPWLSLNWEEPEPEPNMGRPRPESLDRGESTEVSPDWPYPIPRPESRALQKASSFDQVSF
jgi:hypothetical protein